MSENKSIKILATLGPSSFNGETIKKLDRLGIDIFRINLSHTSIGDLQKNIKLLKSWTKKNIAIDTEGAQLRTNMLTNNEPINVFNGDLIELVSKLNYNKQKQIPINQSSLLGIFIGGDIVKIDFDKNYIIRKPSLRASK